eukprot:11216713-Lingulodinium_polyedra.AAC.1
MLREHAAIDLDNEALIQTPTLHNPTSGGAGNRAGSASSSESGRTNGNKTRCNQNSGPRAPR